MPQPFQDLDMLKFQNMSFDSLKSHLVKPGMPPTEIMLNSKVAELSHFIVQNFRSEILPEEHIIDTAKKVITQLQYTIKEKDNEIERLKGLIENAYSIGYDESSFAHDVNLQEQHEPPTTWQQFKTENNI